MFYVKKNNEFYIHYSKLDELKNPNQIPLKLKQESPFYNTESLD